MATENPKKIAGKNTRKASHIAPLGDRVLIRPMTMEEVRGGGLKDHFGIFIPESVTKEKSAQGIVLAVGPGRYVEGKIAPLSVKVGDLVIFSKYSYDEVEENGEELYLLREDNLLAIIKE